MRQLRSFLPAHGPPGRGSAARIACLRVPLFPLAARLRTEPELLQEAVVIFEGNGSAARAVAATRLGRQAGIRPGMTLAQARARVAKLVARARDQDGERSAQEALLEVAEAFSPRVEDAGEGLAYLDADGLQLHFPGEFPERDLGRALIQAAEKTGLPARVGIASSKLAARVATTLSGSPTLVPAGEEVAFLAPLPVSRLSPDLSVAHRLKSWGLATVGELARLPEAEVSSRLGNAGLALHTIARGLDPQPLIPREIPPSFREGMSLEWPIVALEPFLFVARAALERLSRRLEARGLACQRLEVALQLEPDGIYERSLDLPGPTREVKTLLTLLRLELEARPPGAPVAAFSFSAQPDRPRQAQLTLFGPKALSPDRLGATLARLFALLGNDRVGSPRPVDDHRPESFSLVTYDPPPPPDQPPLPRRGRGLLTLRVLRPPIPLEVLVDDLNTDEQRNSGISGTSNGTLDVRGAGTSTGTSTDTDVRGAGTSTDSTLEGTSEILAPPPPPQSPVPRSLTSLNGEDTARRQRIQGRVKVASGPWTLEDDWWSEDPAVRDYWDVELADGGLYRLYRDRLSGDWFADGAYD